MKKEIICGIYKITSPTGRIYIGQSININRRFNTYKINLKSSKSQIKLYRSFLKHGTITHIFEVIEECKEDELYCKERYWQDHYDVLNGGLNCILQKCGELRAIYTEETARKKSERFSGENNPMWNYKYTEEQINNIRERTLGENNPFYGKKHTPENMDKRLKTLELNGVDYKGSNNPNAKKVIDTITKIVYDTVKEASKAMGVTEGSMSKYLSGNHKNMTSCVFLENYKEGEIVLADKRFCKRANIIIDTATKKEYNSITEAFKELEMIIAYSTLVTRIKNQDERTTLRYKD